MPVGGGCENLNVEYDSVLFDVAMLERMGFLNCEAIRVCGDSMESIIGNGNLCFIDTMQKA